MINLQFIYKHILEFAKKRCKMIVIKLYESVILLLKKFKKKSLKAQIAIIAFIIFMIALVSYVLYSTLKPEPPTAYEMSEVNYGTITDYLDVNGTVESGVTENFTAIEGVVVEEVNVSVGDTVKKGDLLATFNVSGAASYLNSAKTDYESALKDYNDAKSTADSNAKRKAELTSEIEKVNKAIAAKETEIEKLENEIESAESTTQMTSIPQEQIDAIAQQMAQNGATEDEINAFVASASQTQVPTVSNDTEKQELLMQKNLELAQLNSELSSLQAENAVTISSDNQSMLETLKAVADAKKATYDNVKELYDEMKNGWYAENDGIVTAVNVEAGEKFVPVAEESSTIDLSSLLGGSANSETASLISSLMGDSVTVPTGTGITVESYEDMIVSVTVGKSDLLKIKVGMEAVVTSLDSDYEGEVVYVGATAVDSSSGIDLSSITSSIMSGTSGANGALVKIKIHNPDEKIVIGFDVDIKIKLQTVKDVLKVPVESVIYNNGSYFVYVYDEEDGTVTRRSIEKGTLDDINYEIVSGLAVGEIVVKSPDPNMEDGTKIAEKVS